MLGEFFLSLYVHVRSGISIFNTLLATDKFCGHDLKKYQHLSNIMMEWLKEEKL